MTFVWLAVGFVAGMVVGVTVGHRAMTLFWWLTGGRI